MFSVAMRPLTVWDRALWKEGWTVGDLHARPRSCELRALLSELTALWYTRQVLPLVPPIYQIGALLMSYACFLFGKV